MNKSVNDALPVLSTVGIMGLFLPSIETAWKADPSDEETTHVRKGEKIYIVAAAGIGALASYGQGSIVPLLLCVAFAALVIGVYERALQG